MTFSTFHALLFFLLHVLRMRRSCRCLFGFGSPLRITLTVFQAGRTPLASGSEKNISIDRSVPETLSPVLRDADKKKRNSDSRVICFLCFFFLLLRRQPSIPLLLVVVVVATGTAFKSSQSSTFFCVFAPSSLSLFFLLSLLFQQPSFTNPKESYRKYPLARIAAEYNKNQNGLHTPSGKLAKRHLSPRRRIGTSLFCQTRSRFFTVTVVVTLSRVPLRKIHSRRTDVRRESPLLPVGPKRKPRPAATKANISTLHAENPVDF